LFQKASLQRESFPGKDPAIHTTFARMSPLFLLDFFTSILYLYSDYIAIPDFQKVDALNTTEISPLVRLFGLFKADRLQ
jgi:hypothetical protein